MSRQNRPTRPERGHRGALAWSVVAVTAAALIGAMALPDADWPFRAIALVGAALLLASLCGGLLASRRSDNPVGWILLAIAFSISAGLFATQWADRAVVGRLPGAPIAAWFQSWLWAPLTGLFPALLLIFPTGKLPSARWRPVAWLVVGAMIAPAIVVATRPGPFDTFPNLENPLGFGLPIALFGIFAGAWLVTVPAALLSLFIRFRHARDAERQQIKWFFFAASAAACLVLLNPILFAINDEKDPLLFNLSLGLIFPVIAFLLLPTSITIAILRHRLFDIDRIVSRTVAWLLVTLTLGATFAAFVLIAPLALGRGDPPEAVIATSTLVVAALFRPVRRRVQRRIDQRFNRRRYDAERTVETFSARLRQQIDLDSLESELRAVVSQTMQPNAVSLWLRHP